MPSDFTSQNLHLPNIRKSVGREVGRWWTWWKGQLSALIPPQVQALYSSQSEPTYIIFESDKYGLAACKDGQIGPSTQRLPEVITGEKIVLLLPYKSVLLRDRVLPVASMPQYQDIMNLQVPVETPFDLSEVCADSRIIDVDFDSGSLLVQQALLRQDLAHRHYRSLRDRNVGLSGIDILGDDYRPMGFNLLPSDWRSSEHRQTSRLNFYMLLGVMALSATLIVTASLRLDREAQLLQSKLTYARDQAQTTLSIQQELNRQHGALKTAHLLANHPSGFLPLYQALATTLPEETYLEALIYKDGRISLIGLSQSSETLSERLETIPGVESARLQSTMAANDATGRDRFRMELNLVTDHGLNEETDR